MLMGILFFLLGYLCMPSAESFADFLFAMIRCGNLPCTISNVAEVLEKKVSSVSPTRAQLISKGIIYSTGHGEIDFTVPQFDRYLKRINPELTIESIDDNE